jgi:ATP-dependent Clp protease protease subunit
MNKKKFWKLQNSVEGSGSKLYIDGVISTDSWWGDEATPQQLRDELKTVTGDKLEVIINSPGGDVWAGVAMHDALKSIDQEVTVKVSGVAASIASVIAMAGDKIVMTPGSTMMIHRASMLAWGNADDMAKAIEMLETIEDGIMSLYVDRTGQSKDAVKEMLDAETWMSAEKAVELGFADEVVKAKKDDEDESLQNAFSGNFAFSMSATKESLNDFISKVKNAEEVANASSNKSKKPVEATPANGAEKTEKRESTVNKEELEAKAKAEKEAADKIALDATNAATTQLSTALEGIVAKLPAQSASPAGQTMKDYLASNKSVEDYANILVENAGKTPAEVKDAWGEHLAVTMGITNPEILLPTPLITEIEDQFKEGGVIWNLLSKTGLTVFGAMWDANDDASAESGRAKGYNRAEQEEKAEQVLTLAQRVLRPQFVYKYITLNKEDIKENRDTGALVRFVLSELPRRIIREIERAVVIGDGRVDGSDYKISKFISLKADAATGSFAREYTPAVDESKYETITRAKALVKVEGPRYLVAKEGYLTDLLLETTATGGYIFAPGTDVGKAMGFAGVIEPDWFDDETDEDNDAYIFVPSTYRTVGDNTIEAYTNFILKTNKNEYLQEIYAGGALTKLKSAVAITKPADS